MIYSIFTTMPDLLSGENNILEILRGWPWVMLSAAIVIGIFTMTIVEGLKPLLRSWLFRNWVDNWLWQGLIVHLHWTKADDETIPSLFIGLPNISDFPSEEHKTVLNQLELLATGGDGRSFYRLPVENLCGQMVIAVQAALERPTQFVKLLGKCINQAVDHGYLEEDLRALIANSQNKSHISEENESLQYLEAKNRINNYIQRNIDGLQINMTFKWRLYLWIASLTCSLLITATMSTLVGREPQTFAFYIVIIVIAYEGAFFAGLTRCVIKGLIKRVR
jgi:hypothetical protein